MYPTWWRPSGSWWRRGRRCCRCHWATSCWLGEATSCQDPQRPPDHGLTPWPLILNEGKVKEIIITCLHIFSQGYCCYFAVIISLSKNTVLYLKPSTFIKEETDSLFSVLPVSCIYYLPDSQCVTYIELLSLVPILQ